jgi:hypothetical protein
MSEVQGPLHPYGIQTIKHSKIVALLGVKPRVALLTQRLQVLPVVRASVGQLALVVNEVGGNELTVRKTQLTKRVRFAVGSADSFPFVPVPLVGCGVTVVFVVSFGFVLAMLVAVTLVRKFAATAVGTRVFRFVWHGGRSFQRKKDAPVGGNALSDFFAIIMIT